MYQLHLSLIKHKVKSIFFIWLSILIPMPLEKGHAIQTTGPQINFFDLYHAAQTHAILLSPSNEAYKKIEIFVDKTVYPKKIQRIKLKRLLAIKWSNINTIAQTSNYNAACIKLTSWLKQLFCINKNKILDLAICQYIILIGLTLLIWFTHRTMLRFIHYLVYKIIGNFYRKQFAIERLLLIFTTIFFLRTILSILKLQHLEYFINRILGGIMSFILMCFTYECVNIIEEWIKIFKKNNKFMVHLLPLSSMLVKIIIILLGFVQTIGNFGFRTESLVKILSFSTLGLGLAAQDTIKNLFGSLMIIIDRPFKIGDEVISGSIQGIVEKIGLRATLLRTKEGSLMYIPNAKLADTAINNLGNKTLRIVSLEIPLGYATPLELLPKFVVELQEIAICQPLVISSKTSVCIDKMNSNGFIVIVKLYLNTSQSAAIEECKHSVIPLILKLAHKLNLRLG